MRTLMMLPLLLVLAACSNTGTVEPDDLKLTESGIMGTVTIGPLRPVARLDDEPNKAPLSAEIQVQDTQEKTVATFQSAEDGTFRLTLKPGLYKLIPQRFEQLYPRASPREVTVEAGTFTEVNIEYDSGIR